MRNLKKVLDIGAIMNHFPDSEVSYSIIEASTGKILAEQNDKVRDNGEWVEYADRKLLGWKIVGDVFEMYI